MAIRDPIIDFAWLKEQRARKGLRLVTEEEPAGILVVDNKPGAFVAELMRLAEIGQRIEAATDAKVAGEGPRVVSVDDIGRLVDPAAYSADVAMDDATRSWSLEEAREKALRIQRLFFGSMR